MAFRTFILVLQPIILAAVTEHVAARCHHHRVAYQILAHSAEENIIKIGFKFYVMPNDFE